MGIGVIAIQKGNFTLGRRQLTRKTHLPDLEAMIRRAALDGLDLCDYCEDCYMCRDCIVKEWKEDPGGG